MCERKTFLNDRCIVFGVEVFEMLYSEKYQQEVWIFGGTRKYSINDCKNGISLMEYLTTLLTLNNTNKFFDVFIEENYHWRNRYSPIGSAINNDIIISIKNNLSKLNGNFQLHLFGDIVLRQTDVKQYVEKLWSYVVNKDVNQYNNILDDTKKYFTDVNIMKQFLGIQDDNDINDGISKIPSKFILEAKIISDTYNKTKRGLLNAIAMDNKILNNPTDYSSSIESIMN